MLTYTADTREVNNYESWHMFHYSLASPKVSLSKSPTRSLWNTPVDVVDTDSFSYSSVSGNSKVFN